jgi:outer membrane biosynthesis protein TonB
MGKDLDITDTVVVRVLINKTGDVVATCVVSGHPILRDAASSAARQWKFKRNFCFGTRQRARYLEAEIHFRFVGPRSAAAPPN